MVSVSVAMSRFLGVILLALIVVACAPGLSESELSPFDKEVGALIKRSCNFAEPCQITIGDATSFDWDEMYIFRPGILGVEAEHILLAAKGLKGEFNRKIAFLKDGKLVRIDEAPSVIEGEHTPPGMLFFEIEEFENSDCLRYSRHATFQVTILKVTRGDAYRLMCANCTSSPVFAEFGSLSR